MIFSGSQYKQKNPRPTKEGETASSFGWVKLLLRIYQYDGRCSNNDSHEGYSAGGRFSRESGES